ncbi:MAG: NAD-dependent epimerase/dehydratase family protein [Deltaproteobacteria bacterium]|nr:NAD-dependent epimerase/dehydratase family protein [Deltaproteobacteria bacterium]
MKIMVTGGAGFIGSNVVDGYIQAGHQVVVVDNLSSGKKENLNTEDGFYEMDIRSDEIDRLMETERPDILNHHAAQMSVPASVEDPLLDADINIKGFLNLLEKSVKHKVKKCIFISSGGAIYGEASQYPTSEDYPPIPLSPYAVSKFVSEYYLNYYRHQYGLAYTVLRYANIYGPRQIPHGEAGVVAIFMTNLLNNSRSNLYHFPEDDEGMIRDYCYVKDVVKANLKALKGGDCEFFNIGTGKGTKTGGLYGVIYDAVKEIRPELSEDLLRLSKHPARPGDITRSCLVVKKARDLLGWDAETGLKEGIGLTLQWYIEQNK